MCKYENGTWTLVNDDAAFVTVDPRNSNNLVVMGKSLGVSDDGGKTWKRNKWNAHNCSGALTQGFAGTQYPEFSCPAKLLMDITGMVWLAEGNDGMVTMKFDASTPPAAQPWTPNTKGIENFCSMDLVFLKNRGGKVVVSVQDNTGLIINNLDTFDVTPIISVASFYSNNGQVISVCPNDPDTFSIVNFGTCITTNGGKTWTAFNDSGSNKTEALLEPFQIHPKALATFESIGSLPKGGMVFGTMQISRRGNWNAGDDHLVWINGKGAIYSQNGGKTWAKSKTDFGKASLSVAPWGLNRNLVADPFTPDTFYMYFSTGGFWTTTDGGVTWVKGSSPAGEPYGVELRGNDLVQNDLWLSTMKNGIYHSTDAGVTWTKVMGNGGLSLDGGRCFIALGKGSGQPGDAPYTVYYVYHGDTKLPAKDYGIYRSTNAGASWDRIAKRPAGLMCPDSIGASWDTFGLIGVSISGQGFVYGKPKK